MVMDTRPAIIKDRCSYPSFDGIILNISSDCPEVCVCIDDTGIEAILPDSPRSVMFAVEVFRVLQVGQADALG